MASTYTAADAGVRIKNGNRMHRNLAEHEEKKFNGSYSKIDRALAFWRLTWPFWVMAIVAVSWLLWSKLFWNEMFSSAGAVLVCVSILSEIWLRQSSWHKDYLRLDHNQPLKVIVANRNEHWWGQFFVYPSDFGANGRTDPQQEMKTMGSWSQKDSIGSLLELAIKKDFTYDPFNAPSLNPYTAGVYEHGWYIATTGSRIEFYISLCIASLAIIGTLVWAYA